MNSFVKKLVGLKTSWVKNHALQIMGLHPSFSLETTHRFYYHYVLSMVCLLSASNIAFGMPTCHFPI